MFNDADDFMTTMAEGGNKAYRFEDIDGIGPQTAKKIQSVRGVNAPTDVADYTPEDLAEEANISQKRARKAIKGGGGNPSFDERNKSSGTVSAGGLANQLDESKAKAATIVQERQSFFEQLVETGEEIPERRERQRNPDNNPFTGRDEDEVRQVGQIADIFSTATADPIDPTVEKPDLGFDEEDREKASQVRVAAIEALEQEGYEYDEATSETRGSPSNAPPVSEIGGMLPVGMSMRTFGDFEVEGEEYEEAQEEFAQQSPEAKRVDKRRRAPITTNEDVYAQEPGRYDFPGVDTPTQDPKALPKDYKAGDPRTTEVNEEEEVAQGRTEPQSEQSNLGTPKVFESMLSDADVSLAPDEAFDFTGAVSPYALGGNDEVSGGERAPRQEPEQPPMPALQAQSRGEVADIPEPEPERKEYEFPDWTLSRGRTYLNKKVYQEGRDDLNDLRERITIGETLELSSDEYDTFQRVVREGAQDELESLEGMEANIFGDAEEQREIAREAKQGIINNPPSFSHL